jgi:hypothetical protein
MADVLLTSKANNDLLVYESSSSLWKNKSIATLDLATQSWVTSQGYLTAPYNPFNQTLNTSSTVTFDTVNSSASGTNIHQLGYAGLYTVNSSATSGVIVNTGGVNIFGSAVLTFPDATTQTTAATTPDLTPYAPLASPTFTGDPKAPTPTAGDNDTSIATTAFVTTAVANQTVDIQTFGSPTTSGSFTWTKPAGAKMVHVQMFGGGGGGCGGQCALTTTLRNGGAGGGGGSHSYFIIPANELGSTVAIVVGAGGNGSAGRSTIGTGTPASTGGVSSFGNYRTFYGNGGNSSTGGTGAVGSLFNMQQSIAAGGGANPNNGLAGNTGGGTSAGQFIGLGGGSGGGATASSTTATAGGNGGSRTNGVVPTSYIVVLAGGAGGTTAGVAATNGTNGDVAYAAGSGGGGGFYRTAQATGNGANGGWPAGGGGGGGASDNGFLSGAGGNGANGVVIVTTYF